MVTQAVAADVQDALPGSLPPTDATVATPPLEPKNAGVDDSSRYSVHYCTPHMKITGVVVLSPILVAFDPDPKHPHVREFGVDQYELRLEVSDIIECGAVAIPIEDRTRGGELVAHFLQLHVRTLDGERFVLQEPDAWRVVFKMERREELHEATCKLLDALEAAKSKRLPEDKRPQRSATSVPFPCMDPLAELEAKAPSGARSAEQPRGATAAAADAWAAAAAGAWTAVRRLRTTSPTELASPQAPPEVGAETSAVAASQQPRVAPALAMEVPMRSGSVEKPLLTQAMVACLLEHLPVSLRVTGAVEWVLRYSPKANGVSLATLFRNLEGCEHTILLVQDVEEHVFGGFAPVPWEPCHGRFYGSGEAFVFTFGKLVGEPLAFKTFPWSCANSCFMYSDSDLLALGGGDGHHAVVIRNDLLRGCSSPTATFGNPGLASSEEFVVRDLEIWALEQIEP
mmetsp:Transcript_68181/g.134663  ORF Transcript_68181/g.134663 Transcript_68181/m.134663 type:complete len:456 (-) Transcript_68181:200-1567(-)